MAKYNGEDATLNIPDTVENLPVTAIGYNALSDCNKLTVLNIPEGIKLIDNSAVEHCENLVEVHLPNSLVSIGMRAFGRCIKLPSIDLPEGLQRIGRGAFIGCQSLTSITIPSSLENMGAAVFAECTSLNRIELNGENAACKMEQNVLLSKDGKEVLGAPIGGSTFIKIPDGVEYIRYASFAGCDGLVMVEFPESLKDIGHYSFYGCCGLKNLQFPESLTSIGVNAFGHGWWGDSLSGDNYADINSISIGSNITSIGGHAFDGIAATEINVSDNPMYSSVQGFLTNVAGDFILEAPQGIQGEVHIPEGITGFRWDIFRNNDGITDIYIPESVTQIPDGAFYYFYGDDNQKEYSITIHGKSGSVAERYAMDNNINFVIEN